TPAEIIKAGHDMGALVVVNHPYTEYGFFYNRDSVKGGYDEGTEDFDLLELQSTIDLTDSNNMDKRALDSAMGYWNKGIKKYLSAGSDQHDVTSGLYPGIIRLYAHIEGENTTEKYLQTIKDGHSYVTMGPIFTPKANTMFGTTQKVKAGKKYTLNTEIQAVNGLNHIDVYSEGKIIASKDFNNTQDAVKYKLDVKPTKNTWYSFVATDGKGHYAVTNPVWVEVVDNNKKTESNENHGQNKKQNHQKNQGQQKKQD
ncbi:MAG: CehA/McbA family metallohydrolase, partial [Clostridium argentinense]|nr:CehA/McbA family metallohydrolase [Clostridium argentinense]